MAFRYTDVNTRLVYDKSKNPFLQAGKIVKFWSDSAGNNPIDVGLWSADTPDTPGVSTGSNQLTVRSDSMWPEMWDRDGALDHMWIQVGTPANPGALYRVYCDADQRLDSLAVDVQDAQSAATAALGAVGTAQSAAAAAQSTATTAQATAAAAQTTANSRETTAGAQAKADAAQAAAIAVTSTYLSVSKNLYDKSAADVQVGYTLSSGGPAASALYTLTGFVPVTAGQTYTLSNPRNLAFYNSAQTFISGSDVNNPGSPVYTGVAPAGAAYVRASYLTANYDASFQIEKSPTATAYAPFGRTLLGVTVPESALPTIVPEKTSFAFKSKNLANPADYAVGYYLQSDSLVVVNATYTTTGFIPVKAGLAYTVSNPRAVGVYDAYKVFQPSAYVNVPSGAATTVTPAADGFLRATFNTALYSTTFQVEQNSSATGYVAYAVTIPGLASAKAGPVQITKSGSILAATTDMSGQNLTQAMTLDGSPNGAFNWLVTSLAGTTRHVVSDSVTPLRTTLGTIGANHGFATVRSFTNPDGKTTADLGSRWTDGTVTYTLLQIDSAGKLILGGPSALDGNGVVTTTPVAPGADLTHVSGATKTGTILLSTISAVGAYQMYPAVRAVSVRATLDGAGVVDGTSSGHVLRIVESYEILDYADLVSRMQANIGSAYTSLPVTGAIRVSNTFELRAPGVWTISSVVTALTKQTLGACGFVQSEVMATPAGGSVWRWVPGVAAIGGFNWNSGVDLAGYAVTQNVTSADLMDAAKPPTWMVEWARLANGTNVLGFAHGYIPDKTDGSQAARVTAAPAYYWDLRATKKSYPNVISAKTLLPGERLSVESFRAYLDPAFPIGFAVQDAQAAYGFVRAASVTAQPAPLLQQIGRSVTPLIQQGLTINAAVVDAEGLAVTGTGAAVAKLT